MALEELASSLQLAQKAVDQFRAGDERYSHITDAEMGKVVSAIEDSSKWLQEKRTLLASCPRPNNPPTNVNEIRVEKNVS